MALNPYEKRLLKAVEDVVHRQVFWLLESEKGNFSKEEAFSAADKVTKAAAKRFKELLEKGK